MAIDVTQVTEVYTEFNAPDAVVWFPKGHHPVASELGPVRLVKGTWDDGTTDREWLYKGVTHLYNATTTTGAINSTGAALQPSTVVKDPGKVAGFEVVVKYADSRSETLNYGMKAGSVSVQGGHESLAGAGVNPWAPRLWVDWSHWMTPVTEPAQVTVWVPLNDQDRAWLAAQSGLTIFPTDVDVRTFGALTADDPNFTVIATPWWFS